MAVFGGVNPALRLVLSVVLNDFSDDEVQKLLGEFRIEIGLLCQVFEPFDLLRLARGIGRGKVVLRLELAHGLRVLEAFAQRVDKDCVQPVDAGAVPLEQFSGALCGVVSQWRTLSV